ncbi:MAG: hypothetical protein HY898_26645 [Deltaproteobacteria bacterium]|nr:hypothetical protein [Deltaproteobacteria bacterium]
MPIEPRCADEACEPGTTALINGARVWFGLDLGMDHMNATRAGATDDRDMPPTVPVIIPSGGFDVTARTEGVSVGAGLFVGTPLGYGIGLQFGARLVVGMF